jgi:hypothetical protein
VSAVSLSRSASVKPQSPRQRVRMALARRQPDRVPFSWQFGVTAEMGACLQHELASQGLSWDALRNHTEDIVAVAPDYRGPVDRGGGTWHVWGIGWKTVDYGQGSYEAGRRGHVLTCNILLGNSLADCGWK